MTLKQHHWISLVVITLLVINLACTLASPFDRLVPGVAGTPVSAIVATPQATFTPTLPATPTPTKTRTPTLTPFPTSTPTPSITPTASATNTPLPTDTGTPAPPTKTPLPTATPAPTWDFNLAELYTQPTEATILSIMVAVQGHDGGWIPGMRLVGVDPEGVMTKSELSADRQTGHTPPSDVIKSGNTKFEPLGNYVTGAWLFHLETADGKQASETFSINMDADNRVWYFFRFQPN